MNGIRTRIGLEIFLFCSVALVSTNAQSYNIATVAGGGPRNGALATSIAVSFWPAGNTVATDAAGNLYVASEYENRIFRVGLDGTITIIAGNGSPGFSGDGGPATAAQLNRPISVAVDNSGNVYIGDIGYRVRKVSGGIITTVAGNGISGSTGDGGPAINASIATCESLAVDGSGNLYIGDGSRQSERSAAEQSVPLGMTQTDSR